MENTPSTPPSGNQSDNNGLNEEKFIGPQHRPTSMGLAWLVQGFELFKRSPGPWMLTVVVVILGAIVLSLIPFVGQLVGMLTTYLWIGGLIIGCHAVSKGERFDIRYLLAGFDPRYLKSLVTLSVLLAVASNLIAYLVIGEDYFTVKFNQGSELPSEIDQVAFMKSTLIALVFTLPVVMASWFSPALIVLDNVPVIDALKLSFAGCLKNAFPFLIYGLLLAALYVAGLFTFGLAYLVIVPVTYTSMYASYKDIYWESK